MWPHFDAVAKKAEKLYSDYKAGQDIKKYTTNGTEDKRQEVRKTKRFESPSKSPDVTMTTTKGSLGSTAHHQPPAQSNGHHEPAATHHEPAHKTPAKEEHKEPAHHHEEKKAHHAPDVHCSNKLKKPEDLTGFPVFPPGTKSLLSKHLSREIWAKYAEEKDSYGFSFK